MVFKAQFGTAMTIELLKGVSMVKDTKKFDEQK